MKKRQVILLIFSIILMVGVFTYADYVRRSSYIELTIQFPNAGVVEVAVLSKDINSEKTPDVVGITGRTGKVIFTDVPINSEWDISKVENGKLKRLVRYHIGGDAYKYNHMINVNERGGVEITVTKK